MSEQLTFDSLINYLKKANTVKAIKVIIVAAISVTLYVVLTTVGQTLQSITGLLLGINNLIFLYGLYALYKVVKSEQYPELVTDLFNLYKSLLVKEPDTQSPKEDLTVSQ